MYITAISARSRLFFLRRVQRTCNVPRKVLARRHCLIRTPSKAKALQAKGDERERGFRSGQGVGKAGQP